MDTQQNKERLRSSLEMQALWRNLIIALAIAVPVTLIYAIADSPKYFFWSFAGLIFGVIVAPIALFCIIRTICIYRCPDQYIFCKGVLAQPHGGFWRDSIFYTVVLEDPEDGRKFFVDTHAIFNARGGHPSLEEYTNKTVTIAYNRETEMVVVIG